jgi:uncharacterized protein
MSHQEANSETGLIWPVIRLRLRPREGRMNKTTYKIFCAITIMIVLMGLSPRGIQPARAISDDIVISQLYGGGGNTGGVYTNDFVELFNRGTTTVSLTGWSIQYTSATGTGLFGASTTLITPLSGTLAPGQYLLVQEAAGSYVYEPLPTPDITDSTPINMSGTGGKVALVMSATGLGCNGGSTPCTPEQLALIKDLVGWGDANFYETAPAPATTNPTAVLRLTNGCTETDNNALDFTANQPTPRNTSSSLNPCVPPEVAPGVSSTYPSNGATSIPVDSNLTVTFSENVNLNGSWYNLTCTSTGTKTGTVSGGPADFTINPDSDFAYGESCTLTVYASLVSDQDTDDPPDTMTTNFVSSFSTGSSCSQPYTPIYDIQGSGLSAATTGTVTTKGIVIADEEGASPALRGFYIQDLSGDALTTTSDGIFVYNAGADQVSLGDIVFVTGTAEEYQEQTQISSVTDLTKCGSGTLSPINVSIPFQSPEEPEQWEGMLIRLHQTLVITDHYYLGRFGQVTLSYNRRLYQPTSLVVPALAKAVEDANTLNHVIVDDSLNSQNPDPILFARGGNPLSASNTLRGGDTVTGIVGVMTYTWSGNSASGNAYRVRPVHALGGGIPNFTAVNNRPSTPVDVGGNIKVAGVNLYNYFNTFSGCTGGVGGVVMDCRGANDQQEFNRQWPKTVAALMGTNADVIGIVEIENDGYGTDSAIQDLVNKLKAATAPGTYAFINADALTGQTNVLGTDAIKVGLLYKPAHVTPVGTTAVLNSVAFVNGGDSAPRNRPSLVQAFQTLGGERFIVSVNHLKSKGSPCDADPDPDPPDLYQGNCNIVRTNAVNALLAWLGTNPTGTGDPEELLVLVRRLVGLP